MSEVKQYDIAAYNGGMDEIVDGNYVLFSDFDRVTAERDALQVLLTAADERADVLEGLLRDVSGRGRVVNWELGLMDQIDDALKGFCPSCNGAGWANQGCVDLCATCAGSGMTARK